MSENFEPQTQKMLSKSYADLEAENAELKRKVDKLDRDWDGLQILLNDREAESIKLRTLAEKMAGALKSIPVYHTTDCGCVLQTGPCDCYGKIKKQALAEWEAYESTGKC